MGLPDISPYALPTEAEIPPNRVEWTPVAGRALLLIHDMQEHFLSAFPRNESPTVELINNIRALRSTAWELGIPVVYSAQPGEQTSRQRGLQLDMWGTGIADQDGAAIIPELTPGPADTMLTKWRYNAFHRTNLHEVLQRHGRDQLIITGIYAHIGCLMTAAAAFMQDIQAFMVADAVGDFSRSDHEMALHYTAGRCAYTTSTARVLELLQIKVLA